MVGVFSVSAFSVAQRIREFGVRMAIGATRKDIFTVIVAQEMRPAITGMLLGIASSLAVTRLLKGMLFGITPQDPITFACVLTVLLLTTIVACSIPAARAIRVSPVESLREE